MTDDPLYDFVGGRITAAEFAAAALAAQTDPYTEYAIPGWHRAALEYLTHRGVSWQDFGSILDVLTSDVSVDAPASAAIPGSGDWPTAERIRVFLDLDGVVSPITVSATDPRWADLEDDPLTQPRRPPVTGWDDWTFETSSFGPVPAPRELLDDIARLAARDGVSVAWCTTWEEGANRLFRDLGMPDRFPVWRFDWFGDEPVTKWSTVVHEHMRRPVPFVWIDDDLGVDAYRWARHLDVDALLIRTNTFHGITRDCWDHVRDWIDEHIPDGLPTTERTTP